MYKRAAQLILVVVVAFTMLGASDPTARFTRLGHDLMCTCGCAEILLECNHVGCTSSTAEIADLHAQLDAGASDAAIFKFFTAKYGPTVLAEPVRGGFDDVAWIGPFAFLLLGIALVLLLLRYWKRRHERLGPALPDAPIPDADALRDRIRNETKYGE
jgi:cytochrome c-type biogenesis protein CcmH